MRGIHGRRPRYAQHNHPNTATTIERHRDTNPFQDVIAGGKDPDMGRSGVQGIRERKIQRVGDAEGVRRGGDCPLSARIDAREWMRGDSSSEFGCSRLSAPHPRTPAGACAQPRRGIRVRPHAQRVACWRYGTREAVEMLAVCLLAVCHARAPASDRTRSGLWVRNTQRRATQCGAAGDLGW